MYEINKEYIDGQDVENNMSSTGLIVSNELLIRESNKIDIHNIYSLNVTMIRYGDCTIFIPGTWTKLTLVNFFSNNVSINTKISIYEIIKKVNIKKSSNNFENIIFKNNVKPVIEYYVINKNFARYFGVWYLCGKFLFETKSEILYKFFDTIFDEIPLKYGIIFGDCITSRFYIFNEKDKYYYYDISTETVGETTNDYEIMKVNNFVIKFDDNDVIDEEIDLTMERIKQLWKMKVI